MHLHYWDLTFNFIIICCSLCDLNLLEDEIHFVCICSKYCSLREKLFKTVILKYASFTIMSNSEKFVFLLKNESKLLAN